MTSMKSTYLARHRHWGEENDPSLVADRCETARKETASKTVHTTLHSPKDSQPSIELPGLFSSSGTVGTLASPHASPLTSKSSGSGLSVFSMPSSAPSSSSSSLLRTPIIFAPASLFVSSSATAQNPLFNSSSTSLFGSTPSQFVSTGTTSVGSTSSTSFSLDILMSTVLLSVLVLTINELHIVLHMKLT